MQSIPHGGQLKDAYLPEDALNAEKAASAGYPSWDLTHRQLCDLELILNGAFSPLEGFLTRADYDSVLDRMRLSDGTLWSMPITLDVNADFAAATTPGDKVALRDPEGVLIAVLEVSDVWEPDKEREAELAFGTGNREHPAVGYLLQQAGSHYLGGRLLGIEPPTHYDFVPLRHTPASLRAEFERRGWERIVAFQTRNPMHRAHVEITHRAAREANAKLVINPVVGMTKPGDIDHYSRVRCYQHLVKRFPEDSCLLSLLPLAMRMGGPREAIWHAIIRKNFGLTHFIVGRDHAGPGKDSEGHDFYDPYGAQELLGQHTDELGIEILPFRMMVFVRERDGYALIDEVAENEKVLNISGTEFRARLQRGEDIPEWFSYPEIVQELRRTHPPLEQQGFTVFFTGLSGSGKSTLANALMVKLLERGGRQVTLLDGDLVRKHLSSELGFSREHRDLNISRIGYVASEISKNGGIAICAPIAPYAATRRQVRAMVEQTGGGFIEVHVSTPIEVCEKRDRKGLYVKARQGLIKGFTGIDDPYEAPESPELRIDTATCVPDEATDTIIAKLAERGYL